MTSTALMVLNPREIPECILGIQSLDVPKCWVSYMPEKWAARAISEAIEATDFDRYVVLSDDTVPTQRALDLVLAGMDAGHPVVTGYCNLDSELPFVNLCWNRLKPPPPSVDSYKMMTRREVQVAEGYVLTTFAGLALTCMTRESWLRFPLHPTSLGAQMDYQLSWELQEAGLPIVTPPGAFVRHVKERWNEMDQAPEKQLLVGVRRPTLTWTDLPAEAVA